MIPVSSLTLKPTRFEDDTITRMLDLRLLHHYTTTVCDTFPFKDDQSISKFWSISIPKLSFEHEHLLDAILSATAFHLSDQLPNDIHLEDAGYRYYSRAVTKHRKAIHAIDHSTADSLCAASIFIMLTTFKISRQKAPHKPYSAPSQWFRIISGMGHLIRHVQPYLMSDGILLLMQKIHTPHEQDRTIYELPQLPDLNNLLLCGDAAFDANIDEDLKLSRQNFASIVGCIFSSVISGASKHSIRYQLLGFAATTDEHFLRLLELRDTLTTIILSHYFALLDWTGSNWWLQSELEKELSRLYASIPQQYQWAVASQSRNADRFGSSISSYCEPARTKA